MNRKVSVSIALAITVIAMTLTFSITWIASMRIFNEKMSAVTQLQAEYAKLAEVDNYVRGNLYGEIDNNTLFDRIIDGYMTGLGDRYSVYYTAEEYREMRDIESGALVGVGIELLRAGDGGVLVGRVYPNSPAARAGVVQGTRLLTIDDVPVTGFAGLAEMRRALMGGDGTELRLTCLLGVAEEGDYQIQRIAYTTPTVEYMVLNGYAYIRISAFAPNTLNEFDYALREVQNAGVLGIVFDVRGNNSGEFRNAYDMIDMVCPLGTFANAMNRLGMMQTVRTSDENEVDLPMAVLVDGATGGAAELFAVSVRELAGGRVVGTHTMGRGTLQTSPNQLADGSAVVVTWAILYTGSDWTFNGVGVEPDIMTEEGQGADEAMLLNPDPNTDPMIRRATEVVRSMVREAGGDPDAAVSSGPQDVPGGSSSQGGQSSSQSEPDTSDVSGDESESDVVSAPYSGVPEQ